MSFVLVDTDILIDLAADSKQAVDSIKTLEAEFTLAVSTITVMELTVGCRKKAELRNTEKLLERMEIVRKIGDKSGEGNALWGVAICKMNEGKTKEARTLLTEALKIFQVIESSSAKKIQEMLDKLDKES